MELDKKPVSMSMKDFLIRTQAVKMMKSEKTIEAVINHQFQNALRAVKEFNSVEISGFGKFYFNMNKAVKRLAKLEEKLIAFQTQLNDPSLSDVKRNRCQTIIASTQIEIEYLKTKTNELSTDLRGMEEQIDSSLGYEEED
jgi:nucleoid DNA-binding protein